MERPHNNKLGTKNMQQSNKTETKMARHNNNQQQASSGKQKTQSHTTTTIIY
jgi:hypothetical protein